MIVWSLSGSVDPFIDQETETWKEGKPTLTLHAGETTLSEAKMKGSAVNIMRGEDNVPCPLLAVYETYPVGKVDIFPALSPGLLVSYRFAEVFQEEIRACCRIYEVKTATILPHTYNTEERDQILKRVDDETIYLIYPKTEVKIHSISIVDGIVDIGVEDDVPPLFLTDPSMPKLVITEAVKAKIEAAGLRGAEYNVFARSALYDFEKEKAD